jgi:hypothetical protein
VELLFVETTAFTLRKGLSIRARAAFGKSGCGFAPLVEGRVREHECITCTCRTGG